MIVSSTSPGSTTPSSIPSIKSSIATSDVLSAVLVEEALDIRFAFQKESRSATTLANGEMGVLTEIGVEVPEEVEDSDCMETLSPSDIETEGGC
jgi:hypothetical protein